MPIQVNAQISSRFHRVAAKLAVISRFFLVETFVLLKSNFPCSFKSYIDEMSSGGCSIGEEFPPSTVSLRTDASF